MHVRALYINVLNLAGERTRVCKRNKCTLQVCTEHLRAVHLCSLRVCTLHVDLLRVYTLRLCTYTARMQSHCMNV